MQASMLAPCWVWLGTTLWHGSAHSANSGWSILARIWTQRCHSGLELNMQRRRATAGTYCVLFACLLSCWYDTQLLFIMKDIYIWRQGKQFIYLFTLRSHPSGAAERPCDDVNSRKFADRLVFVCTDVTHVCVLPTFKLCLPSFGTSQGDTIGWITWISGTISK